MQLQDKVCLVTGGTKGIGGATAISLAERGAHVAIAARNLDAEAESTRARIELLGRKCLPILADMGKSAEATDSVERTLRHFGRIDVLVHAAGGPVNGGLFDVTPEVWNTAFDVHVHAVYYLC